MARGRVRRRGLGLSLLVLSLSAGCRNRAEWVVDVVDPSDMTVAASEVHIYRSTTPGEDAQFVATAEGRASKRPSLPGIYASLREQAGELGANLVVIRVGSTIVLEYTSGGSGPSLIPVPYVFVHASFYSSASPSSSSELADAPISTEMEP